MNTDRRRSVFSHQQSAISNQQKTLDCTEIDLGDRMRDFRTLKVWEKSHKLALEVYRFTDGFPKEEVYGLSSQMRRCGTSIPTNIAEGCGREGEKELARYLNISMGSASELEYLIMLASELNYLSDESYREITPKVVEVKRMLTSFIKKLRADG